jgi:hypothetical protein
MSTAYTTGGMKLGSGVWCGTEEGMRFSKSPNRRGAKSAKGCSGGYCHFWHLVTLGFSRNTRLHAQGRACSTRPPLHGVLDHRASEQSKRADLLVALLLKPPAHQLELLPVVGGLDADLLVGKLGNAEFEYVMVDGRVQLR